jgi:hypothetical protein
MQTTKIQRQNLTLYRFQPLVFSKLFHVVLFISKCQEGLLRLSLLCGIGTTHHHGVGFRHVPELAKAVVYQPIAVLSSP